MKLPDVYNRVLRDTTLPTSSQHGPRHWARVERNGLYLSEYSAADPTLVRLFAVLHDSMRLSEGFDPAHGARAADYTATLRDSLLDVTDEDFDTLTYAIRWHTRGNKILNDTVAVCWDADRLDLGRVGIRPHPKYLATDEARRIAGARDFACLEKYHATGLATHRWPES